MDGGFGDNVAVETVAQVDRVDVVAFEIRVPATTREGPPSVQIFPRFELLKYHHQHNAHSIAAEESTPGGQGALT